MQPKHVVSQVVIALYERWNKLEELASVEVDEQDDFMAGVNYRISQEQKFLNELIFKIKYDETESEPLQNQPELPTAITIHPATGTEPRLLH